MKALWYLLDLGEVDSFSHFDALPTSCLLIDKGKIVAANSWFADHIGKSKDELKNSDISDHIKSEIGSLTDIFSPGSENKKDVSLILQKADGSSQSVLANVNSQNDQKGACKGVLVTLTPQIEQPSHLNITGNDLDVGGNMTLSALQALLESSTDGISVMDRDFNVLHFNQTAYSEFVEFAGVDLADPNGIKQQLTEAEFLRWKAVYKPVFEGQKKTELVQREDGKRYFKNIYAPVRDENNNIIGALEVSREVTDHLKSKAELFASRDKLNSIIEHTPVGIARVDLTGNITYISERGAACFGLSVEEISKKRAVDCIPEDQQEIFLSKVVALLNGSEEEHAVFNITHPNGSVHVIKGITSILRNEKKEPEEFFLAYMDVTNEVENERVLVETENNYNSLFSNLQDSVLVYDQKKELVTDCNEAALELYDLKKSEIIDNENFSVVPDTSIYFPSLDMMEKFTDMISGSESLNKKNIPLAIARGDGTERFVKTSLVQVRDKSDQLYIIMKDMTNEHSAMQEVTEQSSLFEALIHNSYEGIDILKYENDRNYLKNGKLIIRNDRMKEIIGNKETDLLYDSSEDLLKISPEFQPSGETSKDLISKIFKETFRNGSSQANYRACPEGSDKYVDILASQKMIHMGDHVYLIKNYRDITDELRQRDIISKQMEDSASKNDELKKYIESNLQLENFAYIASHDLKAPIRSVISFAQLLKNNVYKDLDEKNRRFLDIMITASTNMQVLIDDLLSYSRINTQKIEFENVDLKKMLGHLLIEIGENIKEKEGEVKIGELPQSMVADASRIRQVFQNLITNAMKFHKADEKPMVEISCKENATHYEFSVRDYGIGIEEHYLSEIFLMFKKLHSENKYKGTGIGLSICKKIVEQHEGDIHAVSALGEGTTFHFTISKALELTVH